MRVATGTPASPRPEDVDDPRRPGWYPDPWCPRSGLGRQRRLWDGRRWTSHVAPPPGARHGGQPGRRPAVHRARYAGAQVGGDQPVVRRPAPVPARSTRRPTGRRALGLGVAGVLVVAVAVVYAASVGPATRNAEADPDIEFYSSGGTLTSEAIEKRQPAIEQRVAALTGQARTDGGGDPTPSGVDLSGTWVGANGLDYQIQQFGSEAVIQELSPFGVSASGSGSVGDGTLRFNFVAADGSTGVAELAVVNAWTLQGTFQNFNFGTTTTAELRR